MAVDVRTRETVAPVREPHTDRDLPSPRQQGAQALDARASAIGRTESGPPLDVEGAAPGTVAPESGNRWIWAVVVLSIGGFMSVLDSAIVNVAIPVIQKDFGASTDDIEWIATAYSLSLGVIVPVSSWLGDRFGLRSTYLWSLIAFAAGSMLCGLAWDLPSMVVFRILQAIPGGILPVVSMTMLYRVAPKEKIGLAMAIYGLGVVFAPGIGPTLGGYLVDYVDWRWIFFINGPAGLLGAVLVVFAMPEFARVRAKRFDVWGFVTIAPAMFALLLAVSEGQSWGWTGYRITALLVGSVLLLALFVVIELEVEHPLLDVRVFLRWQFANSLFLITALSVGLFAVVFYVPIFLQIGQERTAFNTGMIMMPEAIAMAAAMPLGGKIYDMIGPRLPTLLGLAIAAWGTYLLCGINAEVPGEDVILWTCIRGFGNGLGIMTIMTAGLAVVPAHQLNDASAISNVVQRVSAALGLGVLTAMAGSQQAQLLADRSPLLESSGMTADPRLAEMADRGAVGLIPVWKELQVQTLAEAYSNIFLVISIVTGVGAVMALMVKAPPESADAAVHAEPRMMAH